MEKEIISASDKALRFLILNSVASSEIINFVLPKGDSFLLKYSNSTLVFGNGANVDIILSSFIFNPLLAYRDYINLAGAVIADKNLVKISTVRRPFYIHSVQEGSDADIYGIWKTCWIKYVNGVIPVSLDDIYNITKGKKEINLMTSCYTSRKGFYTLDYYVRLVLEKNKIEYFKR